MLNRHFIEQYRPDPKKIKCGNHHSFIRKSPNVCPWCLLRRILETVQAYDQYHLNEQIEDIKTEIENMYFDSGIA